MDMIDTVLDLENGDLDEQGAAKAMQSLINSGTGWSLQGSYGRSMMAGIEAGVNTLGPKRARDYWGNTIPSKFDVQTGTKGSRAFVVQHMGEEWARMLETEIAGPHEPWPRAA